MFSCLENNLLGDIEANVCPIIELCGEQQTVKRFPNFYAEDTYKHLYA